MRCAVGPKKGTKSPATTSAKSRPSRSRPCCEKSRRVTSTNVTRERKTAAVMSSACQMIAP
eukprot:scaffold12679_cov106-Isochrysis_galbana.AAC.4